MPRPSTARAAPCSRAHTTERLRVLAIHHVVYESLPRWRVIGTFGNEPDESGRCSIDDDVERHGRAHPDSHAVRRGSSNRSISAAPARRCDSQRPRSSDSRQATGQGFLSRRHRRRESAPACPSESHPRLIVRSRTSPIPSVLQPRKSPPDATIVFTAPAEPAYSSQRRYPIERCFLEGQRDVHAAATGREERLQRPNKSIEGREQRLVFEHRDRSARRTCDECAATSCGRRDCRRPQIGASSKARSGHRVTNAARSGVARQLSVQHVVDVVGEIASHRQLRSGRPDGPTDSPTSTRAGHRRSRTRRAPERGRERERRPTRDRR